MNQILSGQSLKFQIFLVNWCNIWKYCNLFTDRNLFKGMPPIYIDILAEMGKTACQAGQRKVRLARPIREELSKKQVWATQAFSVFTFDIWHESQT